MKRSKPSKRNMIGGISIVIPAYNEELSIGRVIAGTREALKGIRHEIIVVDDGSADMTGLLAKKLGAIVIKHTTNKGIGAATSSGIKKSRYDIVVTMDADGQHDPKNIIRLVWPIVDGSADIVIGSRFLGEIRPGSMGLVNKTAIRFMNPLISPRCSVSDSQSGFRALKKDVALKLLPREHGMAFLTELLVRARALGFTIVEVPVTYRPRENISYSSFSFPRDILSIFKIIVKHALGRSE